MPLPKDQPYVLLTWKDAHGNVEEVDLKNLDHAPMIFNSPGWLLKSDDVGVSLGLEWNETSKQFRGYTFVLKELVLSVREVTLAVKRNKHKEGKDL